MFGIWIDGVLVSVFFSISGANNAYFARDLGDNPEACYGEIDWDAWGPGQHDIIGPVYF